MVIEVICDFSVGEQVCSIELSDFALLVDEEDPGEWDIYHSVGDNVL
jgi:hypothetical protein